MKKLIFALAITLLSFNAFSQQNQCNFSVEIYDETSREAATLIAQDLANKTNSGGKVLNVIAAELKKCQDKNVRERWTSFSPKYKACTYSKIYIHTKPKVILASGANKKCAVAAKNVLLSKGFESEDISIRLNTKPSEKAIQIILPARTSI